MPEKREVKDLCARTESYLREHLLPFWIERSPDKEAGGFLTYFDRDGNPTGESTKTFLMQIRMLYTMASAHRMGYGDGRCGELARMGADFIVDHYWDDEYEGWFWIADRFGQPQYKGKIGYGQCFGIYAFSEYFLATGDPRGRDAAERTYAAVAKHMIDTRYGGFLEIMKRNWEPERSGAGGGDRKSMDVHMHMMEALTTLYEMTGSPTHRRRLLEVIDLIIERMLHPKYGTGYSQFSFDFEPLPRILFDAEWGRDTPPEDSAAWPLDSTSYGHNVEFGWLLLHAVDVLGKPRAEYAQVVKNCFDHCVQYGIDWDFGGVYLDGPFDSPPTMTEKQFWQQAEGLVGMLDAYVLFGDEVYWRAFRNIYDFVFTRFVNLAAGGEWYERVDRKGIPVDDVLAHAWKISYHSVRAMIQVVQRLRSLSSL